MLAIVIPYYKITFFEETLQSLSIQTDKRFKVYIGDDASPEDPLVLLEKYKGQFEFVYCRFEENLGSISLVQQWNRCIAMTAGEEWLMVLGDDDSLSPASIADFYLNLDEINQNHCKIVRFASVVNDAVHQKQSSLYTHPKLEKATDFFYRRYKNQTRSSLSEYVFKRESYVKNNFYNYDLAWYADDRAWLEFSNFGTIYTINSAYLIIGLSDENISRATYKIEIKEQVKILFFKDFILKNLFKFTRKQRLGLLLYIEQISYLGDSVTFRFWLRLFSLFLINFYFIQSVKFTRRFLIHLNKDA
ncbi:glycosyltransferase family 2 protein [Flavobacterium sp. LB1P71]|uniref:glycosyltransferase family 2 protein n=1 Tax=unclassified Flavobacterium TaxID=196869 RepID=UPI003AAFBB89